MHMCNISHIKVVGVLFEKGPAPLQASQGQTGNGGDDDQILSLA